MNAATEDENLFHEVFSNILRSARMLLSSLLDSAPRLPAGLVGTTHTLAAPLRSQDSLISRPGHITRTLKGPIWHLLKGFMSQHHQHHFVRDC